jgi:hypothetical protein
MRKVTGLLGGVLVLIAGCVTSLPAPEVAPPIVDVRGTWVGTWSFENPDAGTGSVTLQLDQKGEEVAGSGTVTTRVDTKNTFFRGLVAGDTIILQPPYASGTLTVGGDEMSGVVQGIMPATVKLRRQR